jgi:hypothetical protein
MFICERGAQRPVSRVNGPNKMGVLGARARSAAITHKPKIENL